MNLGAFDPSVDFTGRTIVITGGTGVLGGVLVSAPLQTRANIVLIVRNTKKALALFPAHMALRECFLVIDANVTDVNTLQNARTQCLDRFTRIDALVNGVGGNLPEATTSDERRFFDLDAPADMYPRVFSRQGRSGEFNPMVGRTHGAEVFTVHPRQRHRGWFLSHQAEPILAHRS